MKKKENLLNYLLSIGFIFLILIFLGLIITITKYSLADQSIVNKHVTETKNLIENINEVEKSVEEKKNDEEIPQNTQSNEIFEEKYSNINNDIIKINTINIKNIGIITLNFNTTIEQFDNIYYLKNDNKLNLEKGSSILYKTSNLPQIGNILDVKTTNDNTKENNENQNLQTNASETIYSVLNIETQKVQEIKNSQIMGKIILKYG